MEKIASSKFHNILSSLTNTCKAQESKKPFRLLTEKALGTFWKGQVLKAFPLPNTWKKQVPISTLKADAPVVFQNPQLATTGGFDFNGN